LRKYSLIVAVILAAVLALLLSHLVPLLVEAATTIVPGSAKA
jgi:ribosomal protein L11 methylase PrmA